MDSPLAPDHATFIQGHVTMVLSSRDAAHRPVLVRGLGCSVSADRRSLRVYVSEQQSGAVREAIRQTQAVAVFFTRPSTHKALQLKGRDARLQPLDEDDRRAMQQYQRLCAEELGSLGYAEPFTRALLAVELDDALAVCFTPDSVFEQTPGPAAGERLGVQA